jgi:hypothetical protein
MLMGRQKERSTLNFQLSTFNPAKRAEAKAEQVEKKPIRATPAVPGLLTNSIEPPACAPALDGKPLAFGQKGLD